MSSVNSLRKCRVCGKEAHNKEELDLFIKGKKSKYGRKLLCKECCRKISKEYRDKNLEHRREADRKNYRKHREHYRAKKRKWNSKFYKKKKQEIFKVLGDKCSKCGFSDKRVLQIDHINGGGNKHRQKCGGHNYLKYVLDHPEEFQILCANCNQIKKHEKKEYAHKYPLE